MFASDCRAMAIGARSQAARTYLEKFLEDLKECDLEELVKHGLRALRDTLPNEVGVERHHSLSGSYILLTG